MRAFLAAAAIYGANASGKTNVILALQFMVTVVVNSHARWQPDRPLVLQPFAGAEDSPTTFKADFILGGVRYQYGFSLSTEAVQKEWLHAYPVGKKQVWFNRESGKAISLGANLQGDNRTIERLTRPNSLFLSAAAQNNHAALSRLYRWFSQSVIFEAGERSTLPSRLPTLCEDEGFKRALTHSVSLADLGINGLNVEDEPQEMTPFVKKLLALFPATPPAAENPPTEDRAPGRGTERKVRFLHKIGDSTLTFDPWQESKGTVAFVSILHLAFHVLGNGSVLSIDELDESLHPLLAMEVIRLFNDPATNPKGAQLIFNTHDTNLLSADVLRRDQIWFTEKGPDGASQLYPLTDFKPRRNENLQSGYLQGRYGAIPFLNADRFIASVNGSHEEEPKQ
jgi:hypothetical protein